jgi:hypothetical protein
LTTLSPDGPYSTTLTVFASMTGPPGGIFWKFADIDKLARFAAPILGATGGRSLQAAETTAPATNARRSQTLTPGIRANMSSVLPAYTTRAIATRDAQAREYHRL